MTTRNPNVTAFHKAMYGATPEDLARAQQPAPDAQAVAVAAPVALDINAALQLDSAWTAETRRPEPEQTRRLLSWHKGLNATRGAGGERMANYAGWAIEVPMPEDGMEITPDDEALVNAIEVLYAMQHPDGAAYAAPIVVQHKGDEESQGKPRAVHYCALSQASLYVVCEGIPSNSQMRSSTDNRWGVAYGWAAGRSRLQFQVFVKELIEAGYFEPMLATFAGPITEMVLMALRHQNRVLNVADKLRQQRSQGAALLPFYAYDLPTRVSSAPKTVGKNSDTQDIFFPVAQVGAVIDLAYLAAHVTPADVAVLIEDDERVSRAASWSVKVSRDIEAGNAAADDGSGGQAAGAPERHADVPF